MIDLFGGLVYGRSLTPTEQTLFNSYVDNQTLSEPITQTRLKDVVALMLASPSFQWT
ncbi:MAG: DUF1800 domain-containing protein [Chloroflexi bacterium]|nr:DUF1800 domain-containing protein [Chloroflexota bacterium]